MIIFTKHAMHMYNRKDLCNQAPKLVKVIKIISDI
jgi:hypothetical protein